jgi:hypothetical protein
LIDRQKQPKKLFLHPLTAELAIGKMFSAQKPKPVKKKAEKK